MIIPASQGNRWHVIRYHWDRNHSGWGRPFWSDTWSALQLLTPGAELWQWVGGAWRRYQ